MSQADQFEAALLKRSEKCCELCKSNAGLKLHEVGPVRTHSEDRCLMLCETCLAQVQTTGVLSGKHWYCLRDAVWSEIPAIQVTSWRLLQRLEAESWAADLLGQVYLDDELLEWAKSVKSDESEAPTLDSNGAALAEGDSVTLIKDLDVKGTGFVAKRGTMVKNIRLTGDPENIEGRVNKTTLVLKTKFLKKA